jgi:hypothetical protein
MECLNWIGKISNRDFSSSKETGLRNPVVTLPFQKYNNLPGFTELGDKAKLWNNIQEAKAKYGPTDFSYLLDTYVLPDELGILKNAWNKHQAWVIKPANGLGSHGVHVIKNWTEVAAIKERTVVQKFLTNPHLVNGRTVEYRLHVLVTSILPLRVYASNLIVCKLGLGEFNLKNLSSPCATLHGRIHMKACGVKDVTSILQSTERELTEKFSPAEAKKLKDGFESIVIKTILSIERKQHREIESKLFNSYNGYQLLSFDFFIDSGLQPWLNEVNTHPIPYLPNSEDKFSRWTDALNIAGYNFPPTLPTKAKEILKAYLIKYDPSLISDSPVLTFNENMYNLSLSETEQRKQARFVKRFLRTEEAIPTDILHNLTRDDAQQLRLAEDEAARSRGSAYTRIYPLYKVPVNPYIKYITSERGQYYTLLFNAWNALNDINLKDDIMSRLNIL